MSYGREQISCSEKMWLTDKIQCSIANHNIESVKIILQKNKKLYDVKNAIGETLLHLAVIHRCIDLIHWLLQNDFDINSPDFTKRTALHLAVSLKYDNVVVCLLNYKAKVNAKDIYGYTPFHLAVIGGNVNLIQIFLNRGADVMDTTTNNHQTCFHLALLDENYKVFELLLQNYQGSLDISDEYGETILHELARKKNRDLMRMILKRRVNFDTFNRDKVTPLHIATQERDHWLVELLLQYGANVNVKNKYNESPLHIAIRNSDVELVKLLLDYGADARVLSSDSNSVLHLVMNYFNPEIFANLLQLDVDIDTNNRNNFTPFHLAIANKNKFAASVLLSKGANVNTVSLKCWTNYQQFSKKCVQYKNLTPLHTAIILKDVDMVKFLLEKGATIDLENHSEIFLAVDVISTEILEILLSYGANLNIVNEEGESLLYRAMKYCNIRLAQTVLINGTSMRDNLLMGKSDESVLHIAVKGHQNKFVEFLLDLGIDINLLDSKNKTALMYAEKSIAEMLIRQIAVIKINNGFINEQNQHILDTFSKYNYYYTMCLAELDEMKKTKCCSISLVVFLTMTVISLLKLLRSKDVLSELKGTIVSEKYPIYFQILEDKMIRAGQRWNLIKEAKKILISLGCFDTLYDVIDNILDNFSNSDLEQFVESHKSSQILVV